MRTHRIAVVGGDGIGPEVIEVAREIMSQAASLYGFQLEFENFDYGANHYLATGAVWSESLADELRKWDAILFGAMGHPDVPPGVLERGFILRMRLAFDQSVNLRPVRLYPGVRSPITGLTPERCNFVIVRENTEGSYVGTGSTIHQGTANAVATQDSINTAFGISRAVDFAFRLSARRKRKLTLCHKKNILLNAGRLWQETVDRIATQYPTVEVDYVHVDAMCYHMITSPERFDVVVTDNLFGDIITDVGAAIQGGLGVAASANLNLDGTAPSMFEPVHGSAPDIAGTGLANPSGALLSAVMCLASLGEHAAATAVELATSSVLSDLPSDEGVTMRTSTKEIGRMVAERLNDGPDNSPADHLSMINAFVNAADDSNASSPNYSQE